MRDNNPRGSGRKPLHGEPLSRISITIQAADIRALCNIGRGNASEGVRTLLRWMRQMPGAATALSEVRSTADAQETE